MDVKLIGKDLLACVDSEKLVDILVDDVVLAEIHKIVLASDNKFDDAGEALLAPILGPQLKEVLKKLLAKI